MPCGVFGTVGEYHEYCGGYLEYHGGIQYRGGYHQYHRVSSTVGVLQYCEGILFLVI